MDVNARATSFGQVASDYHRWRPSYPAAAVDWLAPSAPARVADLGAGTGKLTDLLVARGLEVDAVEPDQRMLAVLGRTCPTARLHQSDSSRIPVGDATLDAVLVADAWHWFDPEPTIKEIRRVLKPGGWLGLVWNVVAEPIDPWELAIADDSDEYDRISKASDAGLNQRLSYFTEEELDFSRVEWEVGTDPRGPSVLPFNNLHGDRHDARGSSGRIRALPRGAPAGLRCPGQASDADSTRRELRALVT
jgi:SAM-dependent methyltransferase